MTDINQSEISAEMKAADVIAHKVADVLNKTVGALNRNTETLNKQIEAFNKMVDIVNDVRKMLAHDFAEIKETLDGISAKVEHFNKEAVLSKESVIAARPPWD